MLFIAVSLLGFVSFKQLAIEMLPNAELPMLYIQVSSDTDVDPPYMETQVIVPLEGAISTIEGVENLESTAGNRNGSIRVDFKKNVNLKYTTLKLQEKVNSILPSLPDGYTVNIEKVNVTGVNNNFMTLQVRGEGGVDRLRALVDKEIKPKLENIDGIAAVNVYGGREKAIEIRVNPAAAEALKITSATISQALTQLNQNRTFLGYANEPDLRYFVHLDANYDNISEIENVIVAPGPIHLKDIATVFFDLKEEETLSRVNGQEAISITLTNDAQVNLLELSHRTKAEIERLNKEYMPYDITMVIQSNTADDIETNINQIVELGVTGGLLAILILWFFLRNLRLVLFIALSIPISIYAAFNLFYAFGISINSLTLIGIALAIGMLLDNSVVVLENIYRLSSLGYPPDKAVIQGTKEVWRSILAATLTTITVFLPFVFSDDVMTRLLGEHIGIAIISTLGFSLFVALLFIPMATYVMLKQGKGKSVFYEKLSINQRPIQIYLLLLKTSLRKPAYTIVGSMVVLFATLMIALNSKSQNRKQVNSDQVNVTVTMPLGSTLENTDKFVELLEARLDSFPEKEDVICRIQEDAASIAIVLKEDYEKHGGRQIGEITADVSRRLRVGRGVDIQVSAGMSSSGNSGNGALSAMSSFMNMLGVGDAGERIVIKGNDFETMTIVADDLRNFLEQMDFIGNVSVNYPGRRREIQLGFDPILLNSYEISRQNISTGLTSLERSTSSGANLKIGSDEYEIMIKDDISEEEEEKQGRTKTVDDLRKAMIPDASGNLHQLDQLASVKYSRGTSEIRRVNREREISVNYNIAQSADLPQDILESYQGEIDQLIADYNLPSGIALEIDREDDTLSDFKFLILASLILIFMILAAVFESVVTPFVLLFAIPLAAIGSLLGLILSGNSLMNANTLTGFLILLGVVVNNGIILIDYANILRKKGYNRQRALLSSGLSRLRPIMITTITTIIALLPMAMGDQDYAGAIGAPFAITVIGGLSFSAMLTLVLVPTVYLSMENILKWYRSLSIPMYIFHGILFVLCVIYTLLRVDGIFIQLLYLMLAVVLIPGITFFAQHTIRLANKQIIGEHEPIFIQVRNLVKIYDRPNRFIRQWNSGINLRKRLGLAKQYRKWSDFIGMLWQITLFAFFGYLALGYFINSFWILVFLISTCAGILFVWKKFREFLEYRTQGRHAKTLRLLNRIMIFGIPLLMFFAFYEKTDNLGVTLLYIFIWLLGVIISRISDYLYSNNVNIERLEGKHAELRRSLYKIVLSIPVIGKRYKPFMALKGISFDIKTGMFGLLGPNGAGKSTFMRIITGMFEQSYGTIWINGMDTLKYREELQSLIGFLPQEFGTYETMTSWNFLDYQAILKGITDPEIRKERLEYVLKAVHMYERKDAKIGSFSGGMKQRIGIALILLHLPRILVVDEPTAGLDPRERIRFRNLLVELSRERIVIFSTHIIEDISSSCNQVVVIDKGQLKYFGEPSSMIHLAENKVWQFNIPPELFDTLDPKLVANHMQDGNTIRVRYISVEKPYEGAELVEPSLEDAYLCLLKNL